MIPSGSSAYVAIALLGGVAFSFLLLTLLGPLFFKKRIGRPYSYLSDFPFELFIGKDDGGKAATRIYAGAFLLFDLLSALFLFDAFLSYPRGVLYLALLAAFFHIARVILLFFMLILPASYNKPHVKVVVLYFMAASLSSVLEGLFLFRYSTGEGISFILSFVLMGLGLLYGFLMANPRFSSWAKLHSEQNAAGEVLVKRPRFFLLAYSEWLGILLCLLSDVVLLLAFLFLFLRA